MLESLHKGTGTAESPQKNFRSGLSTVELCFRPLLPSAPAGLCCSDESLQEPERVLLCQWGHERGSKPMYSRARKSVTHCYIERHVAETASEDRHFFGIGGRGVPGVSYRNEVPLTLFLIP